MARIRTPSGYHMGRKRPTPDLRDLRFHETHPEVLSLVAPPKVDLRSKLPFVFDQGQLGSCVANASDGLMCFLYPQEANIGFSRLQIYYNGRSMEGDLGQDAGMETRDAMKVLTNSGVSPETDWPYDISKYNSRPPQQAVSDALKYKIRIYSKLVAEASYFQCLAQGFPFLMGIELYESFESDRVAKKGVVPYPDTKRGRVLGGHCVLCVGYDKNFMSNPDFHNSGLPASLVGQQALLCRNSWGIDWGLAGHFWLPIHYASDPVTGGDCWTGRR